MKFLKKATATALALCLGLHLEEQVTIIAPYHVADILASSIIKLLSIKSAVL